MFTPAKFRGESSPSPHSSSFFGILFWTLRSHNSAANAQAKDAPLLAPLPASQAQPSKAEVSNSAMTPAHPTSQPPTRPTAAPAKPPAAAATSSPATTANADAGKITPSDKDKSDQNNAENNNDKNDVTVRTFPQVDCEGLSTRSANAEAGHPRHRDFLHLRLRRRTTRQP